MSGRFHRYATGQDGATAVEFAIILPLLLSMLFGIIAFGQYFAIANSLQQFAAEAARYSVSEPFDTARQARAEAFLASPDARFSFLNAQNISHTITVAEGAIPSIQVTLVYDLDGTAVKIADGYLGIGISDITRRAYLAY